MSAHIVPIRKSSKYVYGKRKTEVCCVRLIYSAYKSKNLKKTKNKKQSTTSNKQQERDCLTIVCDGSRYARNAAKG